MEKTASNDKDKIDRAKHLYWEPTKFSEKVISFLQNTTELYFVMAIAMFALMFSSAVAVAFFLVAFVLLATSLNELKRRIFLGFVVLGVKAVLLLAVIIWKVRKAKAMITATTDFAQFKSEIAFYESLGFQLSYSAKELTTGKTARADGQFVYECDLLWSFLFEVFLFALMLMLAKFY